MSDDGSHANHVSQYSVEEVFGGAKQPRGRNALHLALTANNDVEVARLIEIGDVVLLNQQSTTGCTPLMLLAMGHCDESLLWKLLEHRGDASVAVRSETRRTAADYAEELESKRSSQVVERLRALEAAEVLRTAAYRCPVCGDVVKNRPLLAYFWERAERGEEANALLKRFFSNMSYRPLLQPRYHQINNARQLRKELSESISVLEALERAVPTFSGSWHLIDLCCGKSITAALASIRYPGIAISAIDKLARGFLPHFDDALEVREECCSSVNYVQLDVLGEAFIPKLEELVERASRPTALLGMHLCGQLSLRAVDAFARLERVRTVVLSPCCLPRKGDAKSPSHLFASKDSTEQYQSWALHLQATLQESFPCTLLTRESISDILSPKNVVICANK